MHPPFWSALAISLSLATTAWARPISIAEINYNPLDGSDYEFVELVNSGTANFMLTGCKFTSGIDYVFASGTLAPGARLVLARDLTKFASRYPGVTALGPYKKKLSDTGDTITLTTGAGVELIKMKYDINGSWPSRANGLGSSLEVLDPNGDLSDPLNWRSSTEYNGSPGVGGVGPLNTVVINEVLTHTDPPIEDSIELYNRAATSVDISHWYISNQRSDPAKFHIPAGTVMPPHSFKVFFEQRGVAGAAGFNTSITGNKPDFTFNSAHGDEAVLMSTTGGTHLQYWVDSVSFGSAQHGYSFGRYPDFTGPLVTLDHNTLGTPVDDTYPPAFIVDFRMGIGASNAPPRVGPLVINRVQYHPPVNGDKFVELRNIASTNVPLYDLLHTTNTWSLKNAIDFTFPTGVELAPGAKALIVPIAPALFRTKYNIAGTEKIFGPWTNSLSSSGDTIELFKPDPPQELPHPDAGYVPQILVEKVSYLPTAPWPTGVDGTGAALLRLNPRQYGNDPLNWTVDSVPPIQLSVTRLNVSTLQLNFNAAPGHGYVIEIASDLAAATPWSAWLVLDPTMSGGPIHLPITLTAGPQWIRVR